MQIKNSDKVIGYFSYSGQEVLCDGDACIIAGSEELIKQYLEKLTKNPKNDIIRKTRFGEIINGMSRGGAYAFDEESYARFYDLAKLNCIENLPPKSSFLKNSITGFEFIRLQIF